MYAPELRRARTGGAEKLEVQVYRGSDSVSQCFHLLRHLGEHVHFHRFVEVALFNQR